MLANPSAVRALLARGDAPEAYAIFSQLARPSDVDISTRLRLREALSDRGYLGSAIEVAKTCADAPDGRRHRRQLAQIEAQYRVLAHGPGPVDLARPAGFAPLRGRVLHIVGPSLPTTQSGYTIRTHHTAVAQAAAGLAPHVVTQLGHGNSRPWARREQIDGIPYHHLLGRGRGRLPFDQWLDRNIRRVAAVVARVRPAVLHPASDYINGLTAGALGDAFGLPVVYESRGFWEESWLSRVAEKFGWDTEALAASFGLPDVYVLRREIEERCRREADRVVTLSEIMADRVASGGVPRERIWVIPNAVDTGAFPVRERDQTLATRLGIERDTVVIGYISSLVAHEGIDTLIDAYARVTAAWPSRVALLIVGDGVEQKRLKGQAAAQGLTDVIFPGRVPHRAILDYYSLIDVFVVARKPVDVAQLVTPLKPFEAFSTGRTVVMSDVRALAEIARDSGAAELFAAGDPESLATVLMSLLADEPRRRELAAAGAAWVRQNRTWAANAQRYLRLYDELGAV